MSDDTRDHEVERLEAAASWLVRLRESPDDEELITRWLAWCDADSENLEAFQQIQDTWQAAGEVHAGPTRSASPAKRRQRWSGTTLARAAAVLVMLVGGAASLMYLQPFGDGSTLSTSVAMHGNSRLPDGSQVELGALSRIHVDYGERERRIVVEAGEAFFQVTRDSTRPFIVEVDGLTVTAVGTAFNVRRDDRRVVVTVSEGRVRLRSRSGGPSDGARPGADVIEADAGEQVTYSPAEKRILTAAVADPEDATAWRRGVLKFVHEPLGAVVADLNRYSHRRIELGDPGLRELRYTGTVFTNNLEDWLQAVEDVFPVRVDQQDRDRIVLRPAG